MILGSTFIALRKYEHGNDDGRTGFLEPKYTTQ